MFETGKGVRCRRRRASSLLLLLLALTGAVACEKKPVVARPDPPPILQTPTDRELADRSFRRGELETAVRLYKQYLAENPDDDERGAIIYRLAVAYSVPESAVYNPEQAEALLQRLANDPHGNYATDAKLFLALTAEVDELRVQSKERQQLIASLSARLENANQKEHVRRQLDIAERHFAQGNYEAAAERYLEYIAISPEPPDRDRAVFHLAICYALPDSPVYDMGKAEELLNRLVSNPDTPHSSDAELLLRLGTQIRQLRTDNSSKTREIQQLSAELEKLKQIDLQTPRSSVPD